MFTRHYSPDAAFYAILQQQSGTRLVTADGVAWARRGDALPQRVSGGRDMMPAHMGDGRGAQWCPSCGQPLASGAQVCAACGRAVQSYVDGWAGAGSQPASAFSPASPTSMAPTVSEVASPTAAYTPAARVESPTGMAALAGTPITPRAGLARSRRHVLSGVAAVCLVALLAGGVYWAYAALAPTSPQIALARYFPASTVVYAALDLQAAQSGTGMNVDRLLAGVLGVEAHGGARINWATDIQPWAGPMAALGVYVSLDGGLVGASRPVAGLNGLTETLVLQSRDDSAANAAIQKVVTQPNGGGSPYVKSSYGGFTVYASSTAGGSGALATGRGVVLFASSVGALQATIDRANGTGSSLSGDATFAQTMGTLPSTRFGTLYYNVKSLTDPSGLGATVVNLPVVNTYPVGAGWLSWTSTGARFQLIAAPTRGGIPRTNLGGDTTGLATLVPADAVSYTGVANVGALSREVDALVGNGQAGGAAWRSLGGAFEVPPSVPAPEVSAATFEVGGPNAGGTVALLREPSAAAAGELMTTIATRLHWSVQTGEIAGLHANSYFDPGAPGTPRVIETYLNGVVVLAGSAQGLEQVAAVAQGRSPSLSQAARFHRLVALAPANAAATVYGSGSVLGLLLPAATRASGVSPAAGSSFLATITWTTASLQVTYDVTEK